MKNFKNLSKKEKAEYTAIILLYPFFALFSALGKSIKLFSTKKRQLVSSVLCAAIVLTGIPVLSLTTKAAEEMPDTIYISDIGDIVRGSMYGKPNYLYRDENRKLCFTTKEPDNWELRYDRATNVLTMRNYTLATSGSYSEGNNPGIVADNNLTINLIGNNNLRDCECAISTTKGDITITSESGGSLCLLNFKSRSNKKPVIKSAGSVNFEGNAGVSILKFTDYGIYAEKEINFSAGVTATVASSVGSMNKAPNFSSTSKVNAGPESSGFAKGDYKASDISKYHYIRVIPEGTAVVTDIQSLSSYVNNGNYRQILLEPKDELVNGGADLELSSTLYINGSRNLRIYAVRKAYLGSASGFTNSLFSISGSANVQMDNLHFNNYSSWSKVITTDSAIKVNGGKLTMNYCAVEYFELNGGSDVITGKNGAGLFVGKNGTVELINSSIYSNESNLNGGGIYNQGRLILDSSKVNTNKATYEGGGIYNLGTVEVKGNNSVMYNTAGANYANPPSNLYLSKGTAVQIAGELKGTYTIGVKTNVPATGKNPITFTGPCDTDYSTHFDRDNTGSKPFYNYDTKCLEMRAYHTHCLCGRTHKNIGDHTSEVETDFDAWTDSTSLPRFPGNYYLETDVELTNDTWHPGDVSICLNGHKIIQANKTIAYDVISTGTDSTFNITDCKGGGQIRHSGKDGEYVSRGRGIRTYKTTLNLFNGSIINNRKYNEDGGGIYLSKSVFNMYGGSIKGNGADGGGGICSEDNSTVTIYAGEISGNSAYNGSGGAIKSNIGQGYNKMDADLRIYGGKITDNYASAYGGAVYSANETYLGGNVTFERNRDKYYNSYGYVDFFINNGSYKWNEYRIWVDSALTGSPFRVEFANPTTKIATSGKDYTITESDMARINYQKNGYNKYLSNGNVNALKTLLKTDLSVTFDKTSKFNNTAKTVSVTPKNKISCGEITVKYYDKNGTLLKGAPKDAGTYTFSIDVAEGETYAAASFTDNSWKFTVTPIELNNSSAQMGIYGKFACYNVNGACPETYVYTDSDYVGFFTELKEGKDYTVTYSDNTEAGKQGTMHFTYMGNYTGTSTRTFKIDYGTATDEMYDSSVAANKNGWYNKDVTLTAKEGYSIGKTLDGFEREITLDKQGMQIAVYVKADNGDVYKANLKIDKTAPKVDIKIKGNSIKTLLNKITFGFFFKDTVTVKISAMDNYSLTANAVYYQKVSSADEYDPNGEWVKGDSFTAEKNEKFIVYARATDPAGNTAIVNSDGVVVYSDSAVSGISADTFDKKADAQADIDVTLELNDNTLASVKDGDTELVKNTDYTLNGGILTIKKEYLNTLATDSSHTFTFAFDPLGIKTDKVALSASADIQIVDSTHQHTPVHHEAKAATCKESGNIEYWSCESCDAKFADSACANGITETVIPAINHKNATLTAAVARTCTEKGNEAYFTCPDCGKYFGSDENGKLVASDIHNSADYFDVNPLGHHFERMITDDAHRKSDATCTNEAVYYYTCNDCDEISKKDTFKNGNPLGHDFTEKCEDEKHVKSKASCTEKAVYYYDCSRCDKISDKDTFTGSTLGHDFTEKITDKAHLVSTATCTKAAVYKYDCSRCDKISETDTFEHGKPLGHDFTEKLTDDAHLKAAATCTKSAVYRYDCSRCDKISDDKTYESGKSLGHKFTKECPDEAHLKSAATCTEQAVYYYGCDRCDEISKKDTFKNGDPLGHDFTEKLTDKAHCKTAATCTEEGEYYFDCSRCDKASDSKTFKTEPLGHDFTEKLTDKAHLKTAPTCTEEGVYYYDCSRCDKASADSTFTVKALGHDYKEGNYKHSDATCKDTAVCGVCGQHYGEVNTKNHSHINHVSAKTATNAAKGNIEYWYCEDCSRYYSDSAEVNEITAEQTVLVATKTTDPEKRSPKTGSRPSNAPLLAVMFVLGGVGTTVVIKKKRNAK